MYLILFIPGIAFHPHEDHASSHHRTF
ncbi:hypothetical protein A2U01_0095970, partial [Trifolium medium]|nr:hypothetical protein [Trifolium medium]